jgi:hypothetical protein
MKLLNETIAELKKEVEREAYLKEYFGDDDPFEMCPECKELGYCKKAHAERMGEEGNLANEDVKEESHFLNAKA